MKKNKQSLSYLSAWLGELLSLLGSSLSSFAIALWVYQTTKSAQAMSTIVFCKFATQIYFSLFAGHLIDKLNKKYIIITCNLGLSAIALGQWFWLSHGNGKILPIYFLLALAGLFDSLKALSFQTSMSQMMKRESLGRMNGLVAIAESLPLIVGPPLAASCLQFISIDKLLIIDAFSFLLAAIPVVFARWPDLRSLTPKKTSLGFGLRYILNHNHLRKVQIFFTLQNFLNGIAGGLVAAFVLSQTSSHSSLAIVTTSIAAGALLGGLCQSLLPSRFNGLPAMMTLTLIGALAGRLSIALTSSVIFWAIGFGVRSFLTPIVNAKNQTLWQEFVDSPIQGRVFGARRVLGQGLYPIAVLVGGSLSTSPMTTLFSGLGWIFFVCGLIESVYCLVCLLPKTRNVSARGRSGDRVVTYSMGAQLILRK